ncbi:MAG: acetate--CoA ligase family protein [Actinobacteria bacterium]|nr:acetate--CoA ligase family protein [Actinomycetota bacterium]
MGALDCVFDARRVAVVGASDEPDKVGATLMRNLERFTGEVVPISSSREDVAGRRAYKRLRDVPGGVDLAVAAVPARAVPGVVQDAAAAGVGAVVVLSGGFAETGAEGAELQAEVVAAARAVGLRIVGPNCLGVQNCATRLNASMAAGTPDAAGGISLATQSGAYGMAVYMLGLEQRMGFAKVYAAGNKADITDAEVLAQFGADDETRVICFFVESLADARGFLGVAREVSARKPILVTKTGRTAAGARAAMSHTAALAGDAEIWRAALEQAGVVVADSGLEMMDAARALDWQPVPSGPRVGIVTNSGGTGVELSDLLSEQRLEVPELSERLQAELAAALPAFGSARNPVDVTTAWARFAELYPLAIDRLARSGEVDLVVPVLLQRSAMDETVVAAVRDTVQALRDDGVEVPVYVCWVAPASARANAELLHGARVPTFEWPQRTARAAALAWRHGHGRGLARDVPTVAAVPAGLPPVGPGLLAADAAADIARAFGIVLPEQAVCGDADDAAAAAPRLGFPVAAKLAGGRHVHKTEAGGVRLGLADANAVRSAAQELLAIDPAAHVLVQQMADGVEVVVGALRDPVLGPVVMVGLGGVFVELLGDVAFALAPVGEGEALAAIASLRGHELLSGARGRPPVDLRALAATVVAASHLIAALPDVAELDLNPVLAGPKGAVAVDVRIVGAPAPRVPTASRGMLVGG